uniref:Uncharacterized protein n=1 Tax=Sinocyclocheilus grahami TaxID=75366 RepID=A0A672S1Y7_SINGR
VVPRRTQALLPVEHVGFDDLTARTAVQTQLHADGESQVAADLPHNDGRTSTTLRDPQALCFPTASRAILERRRQVLGGGLVHLLLGAVMVGLEDDCYLQGRSNGKW